MKKPTTPTSSPRPKPRPSSAPATSPRPKANPAGVAAKKAQNVARTAVEKAMGDPRNFMNSKGLADRTTRFAAQEKGTRAGAEARKALAYRAQRTRKGK